MTKSKYDNFLTKEFFEKEYFQSEKSLTDIAKEVNIEKSIVARRFNKLGLIKKESNIEQLLTNDFFNIHYFQLKKSLTEISKEFNINRNTITKYFHKLGLKKRSFSEQGFCTKRPDNFIEKCREAGLKRRIHFLIDVNCAICGKTKKINTYNTNDDKQYVCSQECWAKLMQRKNLGAKRSPEMGQKLRDIFRTGEYKKCATCGKDKYFPINKIKRNKYYFCSLKCYNKGKELIYVGSESGAWIDGRTELRYLLRANKKNQIWRNKIFKRDLYTCQECGIKNHNLEAHHTKPFRIILDEFLNFYNHLDPIKDKYDLLSLSKQWKDFWDINNGITLCDCCHEKIDPHRHL